MTRPTPRALYCVLATWACGDETWIETGPTERDAIDAVKEMDDGCVSDVRVYRGTPARVHASGTFTDVTCDICDAAAADLVSNGFKPNALNYPAAMRAALDCVDALASLSAAEQADDLAARRADAWNDERAVEAV